MPKSLKKIKETVLNDNSEIRPEDIDYVLGERLGYTPSEFELQIYASPHPTLLVSSTQTRTGNEVTRMIRTKIGRTAKIRIVVRNNNRAQRNRFFQ